MGECHNGTPSQYTRAGVAKPAKPSDDFPLFAHASGKWAKKIDGKLLYFGIWDDPDAALSLYRSRFPDTALQLSAAVDLFLAAKRQAVGLQELTSRSLREYERTCDRLIKLWGGSRSVQSLTPVHFEQFRVMRGETCNAVSVGNEVTRVKTLFKWLAEMGHCPAVAMGPTFRKPSAKLMRRIRREAGKKMFTAEQIWRIADEAGVHMRAMILLAINTGFQNTDCSSLPLSLAERAVAEGWIEFPREKTEVERRCPLWKITRSAIERSLSRRPASSLANAFLRTDGKPYSVTNNDIAVRFRAARDHACIREGGFSWLRKTFATVASGCGDQVAVNFIMGHVDPSISAVYRQEVQDDRLVAVVKHVRGWLVSPEDCSDKRPCSSRDASEELL